MISAAGTGEGERNHPLALRMGVIAFTTQNLAVGALYGAYGVMIIPLEEKLGVGRTISTLGVPLAGIGIALLAPLVGGLTNRMSLKLVMMIGSLLAAAGFALLAVTSSPEMFLFAYAVLIGPGICLSGVMPPAILTVRWFVVGQGRAMGIVQVPLMMALLPLIANLVLETYGLDAVFWMLAALMVANFLIEFMIVNSPPRPGGANVPAVGAQATGAAVVTVRELLRSPTYWKLMLAMSLLFASVVMIGSHLAPMAIGWGVSPAQAASLLGVYGGAAILGTPLFGWLADRVGGRMVLAILAVDMAVLFGLMILQPSFPLLLTLAALTGLHIASAPAGFALIVGEHFGSEGFGRAYGVLQLVNLPFSVASVPLAAWIFERTGSYANALLLHVALLALAAVLVLTIRKRRTV